MAKGLIYSSSSYPRNWENLFDLFLNVSAVVGILLGGEVRIVGVGMMLRPIQVVTRFKKSKKILRSMWESVYYLKDILLVTMVILFIYSASGVILWRGVIHYRWRYTPQPVNGDWPAIETDSRPCGSRKCTVGYCGSLYEQYESDPESLNLTIIGNLNRDTRILDLQYNQVNFDDIRLASLAVFQCFTVEGWIDLLENYEDAEGSLSAMIFFFSLIFLCSIILMNFVVAILFSNYSNREQYNKHDELVIKLLEWVERLPLSQRISELFWNKTFNIQSKKSHMIFSGVITAVKHPIKTFTDIEMPQDEYYNKRIVNILYRVVHHPLYELTFCVVISVHMIVLLHDQYRPYQKDQYTVADNQKINILFFWLFLLDAAIRAASEKCALFDRFSTKLDIVLVILSIFQLAFPKTLKEVVFIRQWRIFKLSYFSKTFQSMKHATRV
jgi:hypothetical protein